MNRILFEPSECQVDAASAASPLQVSLPLSDIRAEHILNVLHGTPGMPLKVGLVNGPIGTGVITSMSGAGVPVANGLEQESERGDTAYSRWVPRGGAPVQSVSLSCSFTQPSQSPWFDLILAPPRPRSLKRLLPQLATLGMRHLYLVGAEKVEKDFWGATLLKEENYRPLFIEGLQQAGTSILPTLSCHRSFRRFLREHTDFEGARLVAHPYAPGCGTEPRPLDSALAPSAFLTFAVGPEGGWTEGEVALLEAEGFARYSLGSRILRTDTALIALISRFLK